MSGSSIVEGDFKVVRIDTGLMNSQPDRLTPAQVDAAHQFILREKGLLEYISTPWVAPFNFFVAGSVLGWTGGENHTTSELTHDLQMILDRILIPMGFSLKGEMYAVDEYMGDAKSIFIEDLKVRQ